MEKNKCAFPKIDQDLGSFRTQSKSVRIICRDFQYPDGDRVSITINDIPVIRNITLYSSYQSFDLPLEVGINKIAFIALNQGTSGPNTVGFTVLMMLETLFLPMNGILLQVLKPLLS